MPTNPNSGVPSLSAHITHLRYPLAPLLSITTGTPHPCFPSTLLHYHLLTERQLDDLAHFYHQRTPTTFSFLYPEPVVERWNRAASIEHKRRWIGRFVGLRGCASPVGVEMDVQRQWPNTGEWGSEEWDEWLRRRMEWGMEVERMREAGGRKGAW
ncbi:hypothetical protein MMC13_007164 [Lambiella insularis]|nr:hypothetical protein [Lambiella insularis]